ncbi:MAG: hypothetical protein R3E86_20845 [Pseudomonadales bacterium]
MLTLDDSVQGSLIVLAHGVAPVTAVAERQPSDLAHRLHLGTTGRSKGAMLRSRQSGQQCPGSARLLGLAGYDALLHALRRFTAG